MGHERIDLNTTVNSTAYTSAYLLVGGTIEFLSASARAKSHSPLIPLRKQSRLVHTVVAKADVTASYMDATTGLFGSASANAIIEETFSLTKYISSGATATAISTGSMLTGHNIALLTDTISCIGHSHGFLEIIYNLVISPAYPDVVSDIPGTIPFLWQYNQKVMVSDFADGSESRRS